jgi:hypothetical protein
VVFLRRQRNITERLAVVRVWKTLQGNFITDHPPADRLLVSLGQVLANHLAYRCDHGATLRGQLVKIGLHRLGLALDHDSSPPAKKPMYLYAEADASATLFLGLEP